CLIMNRKIYRRAKREILLSVLGLFIFVSLGVGKPGGGVPGEVFNYPMAKYVLNPSEFIFVDRPEVNLVNTFLFEGTDLLFFNVSYPIRMWGTAAFSTFLLYSGGIEGRDINGHPLNTFSDYRQVFYLSYAHKLRDDFYVGANLKTIIKKFYELDEPGYQLQSISAFSQALDIGFTYIPLKEMYVGLSFLNAPHLNLGGSKSLADNWPLDLKFSIHYLALNDQLLIGLQTDIIDLVTDKAVFFNNKKVSSIKLNYDMEYYIRRWFAIGGSFNDKEVNFGLSYIGKNLLSFNEELEFKYLAGLSYNIGEVTNRLAITTHWGLNRQEKESRRLAKIRQMAPINAFEEAMRLYRKKQYWDASYAFGKVVSLYPEFKRVDEAHFYIAESFLNMGFEDAAEYSYRRLINEYPEFKKKAECTYRLQDIYYRRGEYDKVLDYYRKIAEEFPTSEIFDDASYLAGQVYFKRGEFVDAIDYYKEISPQSNVYRFAQYSLALCFLNIGDSDEAIKCFKNILATPPTNKLDEMIVNRTYVVLGHLYFELYDYDNAIAQYKQVPSSSPFYDDALIGYGWSLVNQKKYKEAISVLDRLITEAPKSIYVIEAHLVKGYSYTLIKEYDKAIEEFTSVINKCKAELEAKTFSKEEVPRLLSDKEIEINNLRDQLLDVELSILESVLRKPSKQRDEDAQKYKAEIDQKLGKFNNLKELYTVFKQDVKKIDSYEKLLQDAEYAAATAEHLKKEQARRELDKKYEEEIRKKEQELMEKLRRLEQLKQR
ncbi:MAG: tetratricopeptide repeat protein, partial [Candidatus Odinarchaeia archaeon]